MLNQKIINFFSLIRVDNYIKNFLIFIPAVLQKDLFLENYNIIFLYFLFFSISSSIGYILNDIKDYKNDRQHPNKKKRPIASGNISINFAYFCVFVFSIALFGIYIFGQFNFFYIILIYLIFNISYTLFFKNFVIFDIVFLSFFYLIRLILGALIIKTEISIWLVSFSFFFFFNLGAIKRMIDIQVVLKTKTIKKYIIKKYTLNDFKFLQILIPVSFFGSIIILFVYVISFNNVFNSEMHGLSFIFLIFLWNLEFMRKIFNNKIQMDPIKFIIKDKLSYFFGFIFLVGNFIF